MHINDTTNCIHIKNLRFKTTAEVASILRNNPITIRRKIKEGLINAVRLTPRGDYRIEEREIHRFLTSPNDKPIPIGYNIITTAEALTSEDIAQILNINKDIAAQYMRKWLNTKHHRNLRMSQEFFIHKLMELQTLK